MPTAATAPDFLAELAWRGQLHQTTGDDALRQHFANADLSTGGIIAYCGFDPTADSLTIGNYIPIKLLRHWQDAGHTPICLMGGGTGLIGDPSGKDAERRLMTEEQVRANVKSCARIFERILDFSPDRPNRARIVNNLDWLGELGYINVLRDVGKHFSVNAMIQKDSVKSRLENREQGISYTEFSYMILQAYDFLHLYREANCTVQMAGSDQFGNIVAGIDLIHRAFGHEAPAFGVTAPLVTRTDGKKIGKTEKGAVWLTADRTSPYAFYQYWINVEDADAINFLKWFTFLDESHISDLAARQESAPHERSAQRALAREMTLLLHGDDAVSHVEAATEALFGQGDINALDEPMLAEVFADVPSSRHACSDLEGDGLPLADLLPETTLAKSKREAREFLTSGAISVNGNKVAAERSLTTADLLHGHTILLKRGKKNWHATRWT